MRTHLQQADLLRRIADELDPPVANDPEPFVVKVTVWDHNHIRRKLFERTVPMPCYADGLFNGAVSLPGITGSHGFPHGVITIERVREE
jgi:hypothetical protein